MKVSYEKGVAIHLGPESCVGAREGDGEALTGVRAGRVSSREIVKAPGRRRCSRKRKATPGHRYREVYPGSARSETPYMLGNVLFGNREIPLSSADEGPADRVGKPKGVRRR
jgi:RNA-directed DNA polymerase